MMSKPDAEYARINVLAKTIAKRAAQLSGKGKKSVFELCPCEMGELWTTLCNHYHPERMPTDEETAFYRAIYKTLDSFDPSEDTFMAFFSRVFKNAKTDNYRKSKADKIDSLNDPIGDEDGGERGDLIPDTSQDVEENVLFLIELENDYRLIAEVCLEKKRDYSRKKTFCYPPLFFTDRIVYNVFNTEGFKEIVRRNSNKFDEASSNDFLNTLLTSMGSCGSVTDIDKFDCRPLSDFTGHTKDDHTPCCEINPNYRVFYVYLKETFQKEITQSAFVQQKKQYYDELIGKLSGISRL